MNLRFKMIIILLALVLIPAIQVSSVEIKNVRFSTESLKTRIVFELDEKAQYEAKQDKKNSVTVSILKANLADPNKQFTLNNELVKNLDVKQSNDNVSVKISLEKLAKYKTFSLESPNRIVIDLAPVVTPVENILTPEIVELSQEEIRAIATPISTNTSMSKIANAEATVASIEPPVRFPMELSKEPTVPDAEVQLAVEPMPAEKQSASWLMNMDYQILFLYCFDLIVLAFMILIILRMKSIYKFTNGLLNERLAFADMINGVKNGQKQDYEKPQEKEEQQEDTKDSDDGDSNDEIENDIYIEPKNIPKQHELAGSRSKILVIDDKNVTFGLVSLVSQSHGYEAIQASNEEEGMAKAISENPSLILIDSPTLGTEISEICTRLKADKRTEKIAVIMIIGEGTGDAILKARESGADDYIVKPFTRKQLLEKIDKHISVPKVKRIFKFLGGLLYQS